MALAMAGCLTIGLAAATEVQAAPPYPDDITPGELRGISMNPGDPWGLGYWEYLPSNYDDLAPGETLPLLVFLPGIGEYDDVSVCPGNTDVCDAAACGGDGLCRNLTWGPQQHMRVGAWDDGDRPFIFVSPQNDVPPFSTTEWNIAELDAFFEYIIENYPVDPRRLYLTGMSQGGRGVLQYVNVHARRFTAVAPMPGGVIFPTEVGCNFEDTGLWIFHGENDNNANLGVGTFSPCWMVQVEDMYQHPGNYPGYAACTNRVGDPHPPGRISMFDNVGHFAWVQAIDPVNSGFPNSEWPSDQGCGIAADFYPYAAANDADGVYSWFLSLDRPDVTPPDDLATTIDGNPVELVASVIDDDAITWEWTQTSGPAATLDGPDSGTLALTDLLPFSVYTFEVRAVDADGQWDMEEVVLTTLAEVGGSTGTIDPSGGGSTGIIDPTGGGSTGIIDPSGGGSTGIIDPSAGGSTGVDPSVGSTGIDPSGGDTAIDPSVGSTGIDPSAGSTGIDPSAGSTGIDPSAGSTGIDPSAGSTGIDPSAGSTGGGETSSGGETTSGAETTSAGSTGAGSTGGAETSGGGSTGGGESSGTGASGGPTTTATTDASASASDTVADTTDGASASASASASGATASASDTASAGDTEATGDTAGITGEEPLGCACTTDPSRDPAHGLPWASVVGLGLLRRVRRRRS